MKSVLFRFSVGAWIVLAVFHALVSGAQSEGAISPAREIEQLRREIAHHDALYHRAADPEIADADYDQLRRRLAEMEQRHPEVAQSIQPLPMIGDDRTGLFQTRQHRSPMLSLLKAYSESELRTFHDRIARAAGRQDISYSIEPKVDGLAINVTYVNGQLVHAVTRGNGIEGDDITANVLKIAGLPRDLRAASTRAAGAIPHFIELRGEIYVPLAEFERVNAERELAGEPPFANPRNLAAGTVRQIAGNEVERRGLRVVFFGVGTCEPLDILLATQHALLEQMAGWGLPVLAPVIARGADDLVQGVNRLAAQRGTVPYPVDGVVVKLDSFSLQRELGASEQAPRWAIAYKLPAERVETQLRSITLQVGRTGVITPVAELVPVEVGGSMVARALLHNQAEITRKDIRVGDYVYIEKAGDVIPAVVGVNLSRRIPTARPFAFPRGCPECGSALEQREREVAVRCSAEECPARLRRRLEHFASKACVDIEGLGPAMVATLVAKGWLTDLPDLYRLRRTDLLTLGRNNEKSIDRLLAAIERSRRAELWRVIHGLGLPQVGAVAARELAQRHGSLEALAAATTEPRHRAMMFELVRLGFGPEPSVESLDRANPPAGTLTGKTFVLTGTLPNLTRAQATGTITAAGGKVVANMGRAIDYIVVGTGPGAKLEQARALNVLIIDEAEMLRLAAGK